MKIKSDDQDENVEEAGPDVVGEREKLSISDIKRENDDAEKSNKLGNNDGHEGEFDFIVLCLRDLENEVSPSLFRKAVSSVEKYIYFNIDFNGLIEFEPPII